MHHSLRSCLGVFLDYVYSLGSRTSAHKYKQKQFRYPRKVSLPKEHLMSITAHGGGGGR